MATATAKSAPFPSCSSWVTISSNGVTGPAERLPLGLEFLEASDAALARGDPIVHHVNAFANCLVVSAQASGVHSNSSIFLELVVKPTHNRTKVAQELEEHVLRDL